MHHLSNRPCFPASPRRCPNVVLMLAQRRSRWANIKTTLWQRFLLAGDPSPIPCGRLSGHVHWPAVECTMSPAGSHFLAQSPEVAGLMLSRRCKSWVNHKPTFWINLFHSFPNLLYPTRFRSRAESSALFQVAYYSWPTTNLSCKVKMQQLLTFKQAVTAFWICRAEIVWLVCCPAFPSLFHFQDRV